MDESDEARRIAELEAEVRSLREQLDAANAAIEAMLVIGTHGRTEGLALLLDAALNSEPGREERNA